MMIESKELSRMRKVFYIAGLASAIGLAVMVVK